MSRCCEVTLPFWSYVVRVSCPSGSRSLTGLCAASYSYTVVKLAVAGPLPGQVSEVSPARGEVTERRSPGTS